MTTTLPASLFRFVQVRRLSPTGRRPPPKDLPKFIFDFSDDLLPTALDTMQGGDRGAAAQLSASVMAQLSSDDNVVAAALRALLRRAATNDHLTLGDLRSSGPSGLPENAADSLDAVIRRAVSVVVLEHWLGRDRSRSATRARRLLQGAVIARLAASSLDDALRVSDLIRGRSIVLPQPDLAVPVGGVSTTPGQLFGDLLRVRARSFAAGRAEDPTLDDLRDFPLGDLAPVVDRALAAAARLGIPSDKRVSALSGILDGDIDTGSDIDQPPIEVPPIPGPSPSLPVLEARARVLGRGDLMIVRIEHARYELGEIAYIENVLRSELRARTHIIDTATSEKIVETTDLFSETSQDLATTERFGLEDAATSANTSTTSMSAGMSMSGGFGPVSVGIELNAGSSTTTSDSNTSSTSYGKEVTDKATETMRNSASSRTVTTNRTRITETNRHDFDNRSGDEHVRGIYRWLNKVDRAQVYNYGERLLLEFVVPEPAGQHVYLASTTAAEGEPTAPNPMDFGPDAITEYNFVALGRRYDAVGLERPPAPQVTIAAEFAFPPGQAAEVPAADPDEELPPTANVLAVQTAEVAVPEGYAAGTVITSIVYGEGFGLPTVEVPDLPPGLPALEFYPVAIAIGGRRLTISGADTEEAHVIELEERRAGPLPVALGSKQGWGVAIAMRIVAYRTPEAYKAWQHRTFESIQQAYLTKLSAYTTELSVAQIRAGYTAITASSVNRGIEVRELTRGCQTILTGQEFDLFGSLDYPADDSPRIDIDEAWIEADVIQFFSDVFDWHLMTYLFYPYQWAGRSRWAELAVRTSADPLHEAFLQAGAARVVVPVREGFEHTVARYLEDGVVPEWGPEPWRGRPSGFLPVDELIADANDRPGEEVAIGEPWEVVAPTTLVYLQEDAELNPVTGGEPSADVVV
jgi:hypothetical protein